MKCFAHVKLEACVSSRLCFVHVAVVSVGFVKRDKNKILSDSDTFPFIHLFVDSIVCILYLLSQVVLAVTLATR